MENIDWDTLRSAAAEAAKRSYSPYSKFPVGAAAFTEDGRLITGCNVENVSYGLTLCAECGLVSALHLSGGGKIVASVATNPAGKPLSPSGRCRQLLLEAGGPDLIVDGPGGPRNILE